MYEESILWLLSNILYILEKKKHDGKFVEFGVLIGYIYRRLVDVRPGSDKRSHYRLVAVLRGSIQRRQANVHRLVDVCARENAADTHSSHGQTPRYLETNAF
jgi:hypothetical protein